MVINSYSELRGRINKKLKDIQDVCFVCTLNREEIDKNNKNNFNRHINVQLFQLNKYIIKLIRMSIICLIICSSSQVSMKKKLL